ncbi:hypothetical protein ANCDUO_13908 [Ancylostoma duodenale]|uniref:Uncharacterized protein n=1 Tax=Ancylostoma duodenale TaxID=51022 RepID=A0A0C2D1N5_9BILA|nr:hypothetical protein ANCDUO_13908 [Ancylostoma duodenale]
MEIPENQQIKANSCTMTVEKVRNITNGEPLYMGTTKNTDGCKEVTCPAGYACNDATLLCERSATTSSSTSASTSSSTASSTSASGATTTIAPSPQAQFPTG